jgi:putative DNA primase/helicase
MASAEAIAQALGGRKTGAAWMARCPAHDDRTPSLSIRDTDDGKVLVCCHAGCAQEQVFSILRSRGLWTSNGPQWHPKQRPSVQHKPDQDDTTRTEIALAIWQATTPAANTVVETYLASRGLHLPQVSTLRFHAGLKHPSGGIWPVMVALVTNGVDGSPLAIHRTFLAPDGLGKAPVEPQKMMRGTCRGGAVRLADVADVLMVGEGIETCLAAMKATGNPAWAALSTSGLRTLDLPGNIFDVIVLADGDEAGEAAARDCAWRWKREGRRVRIARPPRGMDFNDMLLDRAPLIEEGVQ